MQPAGNEPTDVLTRDDCEDAVALPITPKTRLTVIYSSGLLPSTGSKKNTYTRTSHYQERRRRRLPIVSLTVAVTTMTGQPHKCTSAACSCALLSASSAFRSVRL